MLFKQHLLFHISEVEADQEKVEMLALLWSMPNKDDGDAILPRKDIQAS